MSTQHFLSLLDCSPQQLQSILERAIELKRLLRAGIEHKTLPGRVLGMIFEKASTRTRLSFEVGMYQLGGHAVFLSAQNTQMGRGEPIADTAKVVSSMLDVIMIRSYAHATVTGLADNATVPVINGLTDLYHPCQLLADMQTYIEHRGSIAGRTVAWIGDGNNMCNSYINASRQFNFTLNIACPKHYLPPTSILDFAGDAVNISQDPLAAAAGADLIVTDVWASMGDEAQQEQRAKAFQPYQVNSAVMQVANNDALFMHCLPAHRGEEVTAGVIDGPHSVIWDEAENRMHAQKALLEFLLLDNGS